MVFQNIVEKFMDVMDAVNTDDYSDACAAMGEAVKHAEKVSKDRIAELLGALKLARENCGCSIKERLSGHRVECWVPDTDAAIALAETP
jgi:hypothetical protein